MAYVALYRAYRPQKFSEVVGQQHIIKTLQNAISLNKVAHAYLFCGPRGTGKTTLAKIMAKALNCEHGPSIEPCDECEICKGIQKGMISDVVEIDAASNNGADDIRALRETVKFLPAHGKYKVYIIDEVHMLSNAAFNALLKTLEEPPAHVIFILATTEPYKLPNTILSRCQRFDFQSISMDDILKRLNIVADEENIKITDDAKYQIAASAEGGMRDALSLFDQCISYSINPEITLDDVLSVSGNISYFKIIDLLNKCISENESDALVMINSMLKEGKEVPRIINDIILFLRDVLLYKNNAILEKKMMFDNEEFKKLANNISKPLIYKWLDILNEALGQMRFSIQKRAFLELAILKMNDTSLQEEANLLDRLDSLEKTVHMLTNNRNMNQNINNNNPYYNSYINQPPQQVIEPQIPSVEELERIRNAVNNIDVKPAITPITSTPTHEGVKVDIAPINNENTLPKSEYITIDDIEKILYNASKEKKEKLLSQWNQIAERYSNVFSIQILFNGNIVAASDDAFIVELQDVGFCNRVMLYENYVKIIEIFNEFNLNIKDYICVPKAIWKKILDDFKAKRTPENPQPKLDDIQINIKRRKIPASFEKPKEDGLINEIKQLFTENELKIVEE